jgi:hypothetical protein
MTDQCQPPAAPVFAQINGRPLVAAEGTERLAAAAATADGRFLLTGGAKGSVRLRWLHSLQVACYPYFNQTYIKATLRYSNAPW